jgi:hypothetical protein
VRPFLASLYGKLAEVGPGGVLTGIYGERRIVYLWVRQFDESDATPVVIEDHLKQGNATAQELALLGERQFSLIGQLAL